MHRQATPPFSAPILTLSDPQPERLTDGHHSSVLRTPAQPEAPFHPTSKCSSSTPTERPIPSDDHPPPVHLPDPIYPTYRQDYNIVGSTRGAIPCYDTQPVTIFPTRHGFPLSSALPYPPPSPLPQVDNQGCCLVVTTGGTGPAPRDVTPEATEAVCSRMMPGYGEQMRAISLKYVPTAVLSRQTAGLRGKALIINLPGKPKSIRETFDEVFKSIPYCIQLLGGPYIETHKVVVEAFRPPADRRAATPAAAVAQQ